ncbi:MAG: hypothetical protein IJH20_06015 [Bacilli bacterium]|nr:hypothetical protein [Bacilli bacterium]
MNNKEIKRTSKGAIAAIIIGYVLFFVGIIVGIVLLVIKFFPRDYIGTWHCDGGEVLVIDNDNFKMTKYNGSSDNSSYSVKGIEINNKKRNFIIETSSTKYDITINDNNMFMVDKYNNKAYSCIKKN